MDVSRVPFDSIENAQEYLGLLAEAIREAVDALQLDGSTEPGKAVASRSAAVQVIQYNLQKLASHIKVSRRILNDLRMLRRVLHAQGVKETAIVARAEPSERSGKASAPRPVRSVPGKHASPALWI